MSHLFQYVDCQILYHFVTSLEKIHFLKCCTFSESRQILVTRVLIFGSSPNCAGKCMAKLYAVYIAGAWQSLRKNRSLNCQLTLSRQVLCWPCFDRFSSYGRRSRRTRLLFPKTIGFDFVLFNYMLLSA